MEFNLNKIRKMMQEDHNQTLPPELDWSNMKNGIFDKIQSMEQMHSTPSSKIYSKKKTGLFFILFFVFTIGPFSISHNLLKNQWKEASDKVQLAGTNNYKSTSNTIANKASKSQGEQPDFPLLQKNQKTETKVSPQQTKKSEVNDDSKTPVRAPISIIDQQQSNHNLTGHNPHTTPQSLITGEKTQHSLSTSQNEIAPFSKNQDPNPVLQTNELQLLPTYFPNQISTEKLSDLNLYILKKETELPPSIQREKSYNQFILESGIAFWNQGYGNSMPQSEPYETTLVSFQIQGNYVRSFKGNYFLVAGLQYQQLESRFQYNNIIEDYEIIIKDTIIRVQTDMLTGEQNTIYGDVIQTVQAERRIIHYNRTQLLKATISVGKSWRFNSFQTDVYLGGALNSWVQNTGRGIYEGAIVDYNGTSNLLVQNQMKLDGTLGLRLHYFLNQNLGLCAGFHTQKSLMNWSNQNGVKFYPATFSLQLGMSYFW